MGCIKSCVITWFGMPLVKYSGLSAINFCRFSIIIVDTFMPPPAPAAAPAPAAPAPVAAPTAAPTPPAPPVAAAAVAPAGDVFTVTIGLNWRSLKLGAVRMGNVAPAELTAK